LIVILHKCLLAELARWLSCVKWGRFWILLMTKCWKFAMNAHIVAVNVAANCNSCCSVQVNMHHACTRTNLYACVPYLFIACYRSCTIHLSATWDIRYVFSTLWPQQKLEASCLWITLSHLYVVLFLSHSLFFDNFQLSHLYALTPSISSSLLGVRHSEIAYTILRLLCNKCVCLAQYSGSICSICRSK
jgi:hypothetical protein